MVVIPDRWATSRLLAECRQSHPTLVPRLQSETTSRRHETASFMIAQPGTFQLCSMTFILMVNLQKLVDNSQPSSSLGPRALNVTSSRPPGTACLTAARRLIQTITLAGPPVDLRCAQLRPSVISSSLGQKRIQDLELFQIRRLPLRRHVPQLVVSLLLLYA